MQVHAGSDDAAATADLSADIERLVAVIPDTERATWMALTDLAAALGLAWG